MEIIDVTKEYIQNAKPDAGVVIQDKEYNIYSHEDEIRIAYWIIKNLGGDVKLLKESLEPGIRTPDYIWQNKYWELKSPHSMNTIDDVIRSGIKQIEGCPGGIILDFKKTVIKINKVRETALRRLQRSYVKSFDIMIIENSLLRVVFRCKK